MNVKDCKIRWREIRYLYLYLEVLVYWVIFNRFMFELVDYEDILKVYCESFNIFLWFE